MQSVELKKRMLEESHDSLSEELAKLQDPGNAPPHTIHPHISQATGPGWETRSYRSLSLCVTDNSLLEEKDGEKGETEEGNVKVNIDSNHANYVTC